MSPPSSMSSGPSPVQSETLLPRGAAIGRFVVRGLVGKGGMGEVYAAYDPELERTVAIKLLRTRPERPGRPPQGRARLMREAQAIARVSHPNVVVVYEAGTFQDRVFIAMEFVEGHTLGYWMHARQRSWPEVLEVFGAAGRGLAAAHERELVHRDFKPDNVMVGADGQVRVMDFGLVQVAMGRDKAAAVDPGAGPDAAVFVDVTSSRDDEDEMMSTRIIGAGGGSGAGREISGNSTTKVGAAGGNANANANATESTNTTSTSTTTNATTSTTTSTSTSTSTNANANANANVEQTVDTKAPTNQVGTPSDDGAELTRTGATVGTPAYMSPEQFRGEPTDARTDQYSFCVALYEALYGERPTAGRTLEELAHNVITGRTRRPPAGAKVPSWIRRALMRGLQVDPGERWPSMAALLTELEKRPEIANRRRFAKAAAAKLAGVWEAPLGPRAAETTCKAEIRQAFLDTGKLYAPKAFESVSHIFDRYVTRWTDLYVEACEATHVRREQSAEVLDLRMACLQDALEDVEALVRMFKQATPEVVENAVNAAGALPSLDRCEDIELLRAQVKPPEDAATREAVTHMRTRLAEVRALSRVGRVNDGLAAVATLEHDVRKLGYGPLLADTLLTVGLLRFHKGIMPEAVAAFEEATWTAELARHHEAAAEAASYLVFITGHHQGRFDAAEIWSRLAETLLRRMGGHELLWGWLYNNRAAMRDSQGRLAEAIDDCGRAIAAKTKALGADDPDVGLTLGNMALYQDATGDAQPAVENSQRALDIVQKGLGADHPTTAIHLTNLGELLTRMGRFDEARDAADRSLAIFERESDPNGPYVTYPLLTIGLSYLGVGRPEDALPILERAARIREAQESSPSKRAEVRFALARALWDCGRDRARALAQATRAREEYLQAPSTLATRRELVAIDRWLSGRGSTESQPRPSA